MSVAGHGIPTGPESADILSQALLQTGLSNSKAEHFGFDLPSDNLLSCDVQTLTNDLISTLDDKPTQGSMLSTQALSSESHFGGIVKESLQPMVVDGVTSSNINTSFIDGYRNVQMPKLKKMENGLVPPQLTTPVLVPPVSQPVMYATDDSTMGSYGGEVDIDLEDLLAIDVEQPGTEMYKPPSNPIGQNYAVSATMNPQPSFASIPEQYSSYQSHGNSQDLPELVDKDLFDIFGEEESNILDSLVEDSFTADHPSYLQTDRGAGFGGPMLYPPSPHLNGRPYMSSGHMSTSATPGPPAYNGNRQQVASNNNNRPYMLQQQMYQKLHIHGRSPTDSPSPNRLPRPFQIPGPSKMAPGTPETEQVCGHMINGNSIVLQ